MRAAILLAGGRSRRFGRADKLEARISGRSLFDHALDRALASVRGRVIVVAPVRRHRPRKRVHWVHAPASRTGMGGSLGAALAALRPCEREILIFLADMPFATVPRAMRLTAGLDAVRPRVGEALGHPVLVRTAAGRAVRPSGDTGLVRRLDPGRIGTVRGGRGNLLDIDTRAALRRARMDRAVLRDVAPSTNKRSDAWSLQAGSHPRRR
ncbi:NTP transferase domain-containing protein [uncultured Sphingomonas sp.]|uniref:nucleotidyltransferase family protein n=1 Tax=uncultured Sphingomonas sp. TaxID=158754 RepID=UPI0025E171AD|nr:NTP transferase domain-containing protein [uncultured Sphingomonas sp.]